MLFINPDGNLDDGPASDELLLANLTKLRNGELAAQLDVADRLLADCLLYIVDNGLPS